MDALAVVAAMSLGGDDEKLEENTVQKLSRPSLFRDPHQRFVFQTDWESDDDDDSKEATGGKRSKLTSKLQPRGKALIPDDADTDDEKALAADPDFDPANEGDDAEADSQISDGDANGKDEKDSGTRPAKRRNKSKAGQDGALSEKAAAKLASTEQRAKADAAMGWSAELDGSMPKEIPKFNGPAHGPTIDIDSKWSAAQIVTNTTLPDSVIDLLVKCTNAQAIPYYEALSDKTMGKFNLLRAQYGSVRPAATAAVDVGDEAEESKSPARPNGRSSSSPASGMLRWRLNCPSRFLQQRRLYVLSLLVESALVRPIQTSLHLQTPAFYV